MITLSPKYPPCQLEFHHLMQMGGEENTQTIIFIQVLYILEEPVK